MKTKHITTLAAACLLAIAPATFTGCATTPTSVQRTASVVKLAAYFGTAEYVRQHPESREKFVAAADRLRMLAEAESFDWIEVMIIVNALPVKELWSPQARIIILGATMVLEEFGAAPVPLDRMSQWKPIVLGLERGIRLRLN